jgi:hypothetical protein
MLSLSLVVTFYNFNSLVINVNIDSGYDGFLLFIVIVSRRSSRAGKVPLPGATSTAIASSGVGGMSSSSGQGQDASSSSAVAAAGAASANGVPVPASTAAAAGDEHAVHHATVASSRKKISHG